ncbi:hypothetical protein [Novosphingobium huizhouense]|uniref:hypothetical protein n=1 Tax=Novosphingobium huizhouense TaxID=2866625 RepID=UPI001CD8EE45|nr:hypothetical protein [Novosphingobium huizhouense]
MAEIGGTTGNDTLNGTSSDDIIIGYDGDDVIHGGAGNDRITGSSGSGYGSHDLLYGEAGDDVLYIYAADGRRADPWSLADGGDGDDTAVVSFSNFGSGLTYVHNATSADIHCGRLAGRLVGIEHVVFFGGFSNDNLTGGNAADQIFGNGGDDTVDGGGGDDVVTGGGGTDIVRGGAGDDLLLFDGFGNDSFDGGTGDDLLDFTQQFDAAAGVAIDLRNRSQSVGGTTITVTGVESLAGTSYGDTLQLGASAGRAFGLGGDDTLIGGAGNDRLVGGTGADTMLGGAGNDSYEVDAAGDVVIETTTANATTDAGGIDTVLASVGFNLANTAVARGRIENLTLTGSAAINGTGNYLANTIIGNAAANLLDGRGGADMLRGGAGNDTYVVDNAADQVLETVSASDAGDAGGIDTVRAAVSFTLGAYVENLVLTGSAQGGTGNDAANRLIGNDAANLLSGKGGNDVLDGGAGGDTLNGGAGDDRLVGRAGQDLLEGGTGADRFVFVAADTGKAAVAAPDRIVDFSHAEGDRIDLSSIDAVAGTATNNAFRFIGAAAFSGHKGELHYAIGGDGTTRIEADMTGDGLADLMIVLSGAHQLVAGDFVL